VETNENKMAKSKKSILSKFHSLISGVVRSLLYKYVDWERMWYEVKDIPEGSLVVSNWKAKVYFYGSEVVDLIKQPEIVKEVDFGVAETTNDNSYNCYWLKRVA
jgi:hypothetical protein